eukprot:UN21477
MLNVVKNTWTRPADTGTLPFGRTGHSMVNNTERYLLLFGGCDIHGDTHNDMYLLDVSFLTPMMKLFSPRGRSETPMRLLDDNDLFSIQLGRLEKTTQKMVTLMSDMENKIEHKEKK